MELELSRWADRWHAEQRCTPTSKVSRDTKAVEFWIDLIRAVIAADKAEQPTPTKDFVAHLRRRAEREPAVKAALESRDEQPAPAPAGDVPEWCYSALDMVLRQEISENVSVDQRRRNRAKIIRDAAESEIARRVAEATKERDAEIERLKAQLAKWESEPVGKMITDLRDEERESKNREIAKLKAELAESRKSGRAACESLADCIAIKDKRTEERDKLKARLDELLNENAANIEENDKLKAELAKATKPVEDEEVKQASKWNARYFRDEDIVMHVDVARAFIQRERAARIADRDAETERLKAELTEARTPIPEGEPLATIGDFQTCLQRERAARLAAERDSKDAGKWLWKFGDAVGCDGGWGSILNEVIALRLRAEAATTKPVDFESARTVELDGMKMVYLGDAQAAVRCERTARLAAERRLALTRDAWRHRWVDGGSNGRLDCPRTDADIDAAIEAHEKSEADAAGGGE